MIIAAGLMNDVILRKAFDSQEKRVYLCVRWML